MDNLWAPWRAEYITADKDKRCIFCAAPEKDPADSLLLFKGPLSIIILNKFPYNSGHLMIAPVRHVARLEDLTVEESTDMFRLLRHSTAALTKAAKPGGFNVGLNLGAPAGAGIADHLHTHVVPRWDGDTNFMPVLSETKVIPEHLLRTLARLKPFFNGIE